MAHISAALIALLAGSAAIASTPPVSADAAALAYVEGRLALAEEDLVTAGQRFDTVLKASPADDLKREALNIAMMSGDSRAAFRLADSIALPPESPRGQGIADALVALTRATGAAVYGDWNGYDDGRKAFLAPGRMAVAGPVLGQLLEAYGKAGRGDLSAALALLEPSAEKGIGGSYVGEHRAHLLTLARRWPEAADAYAALLAAEGATVARIRLAAAGAALEAGRRDPVYRDKAIALLGSGPERDPILVDARARLRANPGVSGRKLGMLIERPTDGLGLLFLRVAADLGREQALAPALSFARLGTFAAPGLPDGWIIVADTLMRADMQSHALAALDRLPSRGPWATVGQVRRAGILTAAKRFDEARAILAPLAARPDASAEDWTRLADLERQARRLTEAADGFARALALLPLPPGPVHAQLLFLRGSVLEQGKDWARAEPDLRQAVALQPTNPIYLNYLGYSLLDRRQSADEARAFIARAFAAAPDNGAIIDSMGWAEYLRGNNAEAVRLLEQARAAEPSDPTVADHLGDAYWKMGRRIEARHAWTSAAALAPEPPLAAKLAHKRDYGLDVALAEAVAAPR